MKYYVAQRAAKLPEDKVEILKKAEADTFFSCSKNIFPLRRERLIFGPSTLTLHFWNLLSHFDAQYLI